MFGPKLNIINIILKSLFCLVQAVWHEVRGLSAGNLAERLGAQSAQQGVPPELLHLHGVQQAAVHGRGALRHRRKQVRVQRRLLDLRGY